MTVDPVAAALAGVGLGGAITVAAQSLRHRHERLTWRRDRRAEVYAQALSAAGEARDAAVNVRSTEAGRGEHGLRAATLASNDAMQLLRLFARADVVTAYAELAAVPGALADVVRAHGASLMLDPQPLEEAMASWRAKRDYLVNAMRKDLGL